MDSVCPLKPTFNGGCIAWVGRGGVFAAPNLRGGGEYGQEWHQNGMKGRKQSVFDDFIAAAETLIKNGSTKPEKIAIQGESNGGLLIGVVLAQRPDLLGAAVCHAGVLNMLRSQKFTGGSFSAKEYGSSDNREDVDYLIKY